MVTEVAAKAIEAGMLYIPGCMTPTDIIAAENMGCTFVKLFPGNLLGTGFVGAVKDIFPNVKFMVTGGVEVDTKNIGDWFKSGVAAVGLGSKVIAKDTLEKRDYPTIASLITQSLDIVRNLKA
jgi:2-dehydro-3-deoxyphosphogluconate aldolase/(4S)-4-hydroxy-2-oxoglutarate aldolase